MYLQTAMYALCSIARSTLFFYCTSHCISPLIIFPLDTVFLIRGSGWRTVESCQRNSTQRNSPRKNSHSKTATTRVKLQIPKANYATLKILFTSNPPSKPMDMPSTTQNQALKAYHAAMAEQHAERGYVCLRPYEREMALLSYVYLPHPHAAPVTEPEVDASNFSPGRVYQAPPTPVMRPTARSQEQQRGVGGVPNGIALRVRNLEADVGGGGGGQVVCECCKQYHVSSSAMQRMRTFFSRFSRSLRG
jgi:hypothetical protein